MALKNEVTGFLKHSIRLCENCEGTTELKEELQEMQKRLSQPLRVAVVGIMKAGKSTFLNALTGTNILYTGTEETTYTVCWFRYGDRPRLTVHFRQEGEEELVNEFEGETLEAQLDGLSSALRFWSIRESREENERLDDVSYLIIDYPSEVLKTMEFIDTPGLNSVYGTDAKNTLQFLSIHEEDGTYATVREAGEADAIIYAFSRAPSETDKDVLDIFHAGKGEGASPINSIGILTKVDATGIWKVGAEETPVEVASKNTDSLFRRNKVLSDVLYNVLPVCALPCEGSVQLQEEDWKALEQCAGLEDKLLGSLLKSAVQFQSGVDAERFRERYEILEGIGSNEQRGHILALLGQYGILEAARQLKTGGGQATEEQRERIIQILQEKCGLDAVRTLIMRHFGERTFIIKTQYIFNHIRSITEHLIKSSGNNEVSGICSQINGSIEKLMAEKQVMQELRALRIYYANPVSLFDSQEEKEEFLRIMGESGRAVETRLGAEKGVTVAELAALAHEKANQWNARSNDFFKDSDYKEAAAVATRSYEELYYHLSAICE